MILTPQQIDDRRHAADLAAYQSRHFSLDELARMEREALAKWPPGQRRTNPVPENIRNVCVELVKLKARQPRRKQHVLP